MILWNRQCAWFVVLFITERRLNEMSYWKLLKRMRFSISCFLFEIQKPDFIWNSLVLGMTAYRIHDFLCPEMWMIRVFPNYLRFNYLRFIGESKHER